MVSTRDEGGKRGLLVCDGLYGNLYFSDGHLNNYTYLYTETCSKLFQSDIRANFAGYL